MTPATPNDAIMRRHSQPIETPNMSGRVRTRPKLELDAMIIKLFGPGEMLIDIANTVNARIHSEDSMLMDPPSSGVEQGAFRSGFTGHFICASGLSRRHCPQPESSSASERLASVPASK